MFVEGGRDSFAEIDAANRFHMDFLYPLIEALDSILDEFELSLFVFSNEKLVQFEVVRVFIAKSIRFNIF